MRKVYLDYNIFLDFFEKRESVPQVIEKLSKESNFTLVYSPAHCEEIANGVKLGQVTDEDANQRLEALSSITDCTSILPYYSERFQVVERLFDNGPIIAKEHPILCYKRVKENLASNLIPEKNQKEIIENSDVDSETSQKERANINSSEPIAALLKPNKDRVINGFIDLKIYSDTVHGLIKNGFSMHPYSKEKDELIKDVALKTKTYFYYLYKNYADDLLKYPDLCFTKIRDNFSNTESMIDMVLRSLIYSGYNIDSISKSTSNLHDHTHGIYGSYCDIFITRDRRLSMRLEAAYKYIGASTQVIYVKDESWFDQIQPST